MVTTEVVFDRLVTPTHLIAHPITGQLYVTDQPGFIYRLVDGKSQLWLDLKSRLLPLNPKYDESGLLSIVFSTDGMLMYLFSSRRLDQVPEDLFVFGSPGLDLTSPDLHVDVISMIPIIDDHPILDDEVIYFGLLRDHRVHHGGKLVFGPDDYLYITTGDGGPQKDPYRRAQDLSSPLGKILRIDPDLTGYSIPENLLDLRSDQEYPVPLPEIYAYGFRNPWSLTFDADGRGFIGDVGQDTMEEIDLLEEGGNYGWSIKEGKLYTPWGKVENRDKINFIDPIYQYPHAEDGISAVIGGYYVSDNPKYADGYYFADITGSITRIVEIEDLQSKSQIYKEEISWESMNEWYLEDDISIFGWGYDGDYLYLLIGNKNLPEGQQGQVLRLLKLS